MTAQLLGLPLVPRISKLGFTIAFLEQAPTEGNEFATEDDDSGGTTDDGGGTTEDDTSNEDDSIMDDEGKTEVANVDGRRLLLKISLLLAIGLTVELGSSELDAISDDAIELLASTDKLAGSSLE